MKRRYDDDDDDDDDDLKCLTSAASAANLVHNAIRLSEDKQIDCNVKIVTFIWMLSCLLLSGSYCCCRLSQAIKWLVMCRCLPVILVLSCCLLLSVLDCSSVGSDWFGWTEG